MERRRSARTVRRVARPVLAPVGGARASPRTHPGDPGSRGRRGARPRALVRARRSGARGARAHPRFCRGDRRSVIVDRLSRWRGPAAAPPQPPPTPVPARARTVTRAPPRWAAFPSSRAVARGGARSNRAALLRVAEKPRWGSTCLSTCPRSGAPRSTACPSPRATAAAAAAAGSQTPRRPRARPPIRSASFGIRIPPPRSGARVPPRRAPDRARGGHGGLDETTHPARSSTAGAAFVKPHRERTRETGRVVAAARADPRPRARPRPSRPERDARARLDRRFRSAIPRGPLGDACAARSCGSRRACAPRWRPRWSARTTRARRRRGASATT